LHEGFQCKVLILSNNLYNSPKWNYVTIIYELPNVVVNSSYNICLFIYLYLYMFKNERQDTCKDVQAITIYFLQRIIIACCHFSYGKKVL